MIKSSRFIKISGKVFLYLLLIIAAIVMVFPLYTGFLTSVLGPDTVSSYPPKLFPLNFIGRIISMLHSRRHLCDLF